MAPEFGAIDRDDLSVWRKRQSALRICRLELYSRVSASELQTQTWPYLEEDKNQVV
jgi:hypothetical protein